MTLKRFIAVLAFISLGSLATPAKADCEQCPAGSTVSCTISNGTVYCTNKDGITIKTPRQKTPE